MTSPLCLVLALISPFAVARAQSGGPAAPRDSTWLASVSDSIQSAEYEFASVAAETATWSAPNRAHGFRSRISKDGLELFPRATSANGEGAEWKLTLRTVRFGRRGHVVELDSVSASAGDAQIEIDLAALTEWFENTERGLEQGWTIARRPDGDAPLWIGLDFGGDLSLRIDDGARSATLVDAKGTLRLRYRDLAVVDAAGCELDARLVSSEGGVGIEVDDAGAAYPLTVDPILTGPAWHAESAQIGGNFGISVACAGDVDGNGYSDVVVGAWGYDNGELDEGRAYLYLGSASGPATSAAWTGESNQAGALLGNSVATAGDVNGDGYDDVIVGALGYDNGEADEGAVFVYLGSATGLAASAAWVADTDQAGASLGTVASAGDVNGDGFADVIVGASVQDNGETDEGRAFVYLGSATGLDTSPVWSAESNQAGARFGDAVACAGDVDGDGYADVLVGARLYDNGFSDAGRAFLFRGSPSGPSTSPTWTAEAFQPDAWFAVSLGGAGDVDGDGYDDVIVGALAYDNGEFDEGAAFVYRGSAGGLNSSPAWSAESNQVTAELGASVATAGDVNGDGFADVIVGARRFDNGQLDEGSAFVYLGSPSGLAATAAWSSESNQSNSMWGAAVACAGDVDGDGYSDVIVGASRLNYGFIDEGQAVVFTGSAQGLTAGPAWTAESDQASSFFGTRVAVAGDVNGDGYSDLIVGADRYDNGESDEGRAFVYHGSAAGLQSTPAWTAESDQVAAYFARNVASAGDVNGDGYSDVVVVAGYYDTPQIDAGRIFVYLGSPAGLASTPAWTVDGEQPTTLYAAELASAGDVNGDGFGDLLVGVSQIDNPQVDEGRVYCYHGSATGLSASAAWTAEGNQAGFPQFGSSVGSAGDVDGDGFGDVFVGAPGFDVGPGNEGRAYVFLGSAWGLGLNPAWTASGEQLNESFGRAGAGDVNGDGYSDLLVGGHNYSGGQSQEGRVRLYLGGAAGLAASAAWSAEGNQSGALFGTEVAGAGDIDGDGYGDLVVGAPVFDGDQIDEGRVFAYLGSASGPSTNPAWTGESNQTTSNFGNSIAGGGDFNGDGYSDLVVGARLYDNGQLNEGGVFAYYGNEGRGAAILTPQQRRASNAAPIALLGRADSYDSIRLRVALDDYPAPNGGGDLAFLEWELEPLGTPFDGAGLGRSAVGQALVGAGPFIFDEVVTGLTHPLPYHWRARVVTGNPLYPRTPWFGVQGNSPTESKFRTLGGVVCPTPLAYCTSSTTTNGCTPVMSSTGTPSYTAASGFTLVAGSLEGAKTGLIFYGASGTHSGVWGTGFLCVKAPTQRTPSGSTGGTSNACDGTLSIDWLDYMATHPSAIGHPLLEGETIWAQCWFRDPPSAKTTNLTNGLAFTLCL